MTPMNHLTIAKKVKEGYTHSTGKVWEVEYSIWEISPKKTLLTFRGTEASNLLKTHGWRDWIRDALICKYKDDLTDTKGHLGFIKGAKRAVDEIHRRRLINPNKEIHVAGHSLGGGLALPAAHMLSLLGYKVVEWVGFGTPKIYTKNPGRFPFYHVGYRNKNDRVTQLPFSFIGYRKHYFPVVQLGESDGKTGTWDDHSIDQYIEALRKDNAS